VAGAGLSAAILSLTIASLTPTLVVFERYSRTFANQLNLTLEERSWGSPQVLASLDVTKLPEGDMPKRIAEALADPDPVMERVRQTHDVALKNLKTLHAAAIPIATGTDAGNIGTLHGPSIFREFQLMREAGLTPMQILQCTTATAARVFGGTGAVPSSKDATAGVPPGAKLGAIEPGKFAALVILNSNPLNDIARAFDIHSVVQNGVIYAADTLLPPGAPAATVDEQDVTAGETR
jgi:hypothetical protein